VILIDVVVNGGQEKPNEANQLNRYTCRQNNAATKTALTEFFLFALRRALLEVVKLVLVLIKPN
jgi:hypothetical protein